MIRAIERWRKGRERRNSTEKLRGWLSSVPGRRVHWLVAAAVDGAAGGRPAKILRAILGSSAATTPKRKELSIDLTSARRPWYSGLSIHIRLKW